MINTDNFKSLKGKYFKYLSNVYLCKDIISQKYGNYRIDTDKKTIVVNAAGLGDIEPLGADSEEAQRASRLLMIKNTPKVSIDEKIRSKSRRRKKEAENREHIDETFSKTSAFWEPRIKVANPGKLKEVNPKQKDKKQNTTRGAVKAIMEKKDFVYKTGRFEAWEDELILDDKNDISTLHEKTKRKPAALYNRKWYLNDRASKAKPIKEKKLKEVKEKGSKGRKSDFTPEQDALILNTGSERGAMKKLALRLGLPKSKVISRKTALNKKNKSELENLEYKIGDNVKDQYGDEGIITDIENALFKSVYVVQIVNVNSPFKVHRGMIRRYGKGTLEKIPKILPK